MGSQDGLTRRSAPYVKISTEIAERTNLRYGRPTRCGEVRPVTLSSTDAARGTA